MAQIFLKKEAIFTFTTIVAQKKALICILSFGWDLNPALTIFSHQPINLRLKLSFLLISHAINTQQRELEILQRQLDERYSQGLFESQEEYERYSSQISHRLMELEAQRLEDIDRTSDNDSEDADDDLNISDDEPMNESSSHLYDLANQVGSLITIENPHALVSESFENFDPLEDNSLPNPSIPMSLLSPRIKTKSTSSNKSNSNTKSKSKSKSPRPPTLPNLVQSTSQSKELDKAKCSPEDQNEDGNIIEISVIPGVETPNHHNLFESGSHNNSGNDAVINVVETELIERLEKSFDIDENDKDTGSWVKNLFSKSGYTSF